MAAGQLQELLTKHWGKYGGSPAQLEERLLCYLIHLGLDHIAYYAFRKRPEDMRLHVEQLLTYI